jgi:hypothetical protein
MKREDFGMAKDVVRAAFGERGLSLSEDMTADEWRQVGSALYQADTKLQWAVGDWWAFGERRYGEGREIAEEIGFKYSYLANCAWVARRFEISRRRENLTFAVHQDVAAFSAPEADEILDDVEQSGLTSRALRKIIRKRDPDPEAEAEIPYRRRKACDLYLAIIQEIRDRMAETGLTMTECDERTGFHEGYTAHVLTPDTPTGRQARWEMLQCLIDVLWPEGFTLSIEPMGVEAADREERRAASSCSYA